LKKIIKHSSPKGFEEWKRFRNPTNWNQLDGNPVPEINRNDNFKYYSKHELRAKLLLETNNLCCYCECKIENSPLLSKVEHVQPKQGIQNQHLLFDYSNLLISCNGGERDPKPKEIHCDAHKNDSVIPLTPFDDRVESEIGYKINGAVVGFSEDAIETIKILNLDVSKLRNSRRNKISGFIFEDENEIELISAKEAEILHSKIEPNPTYEHYSAILKCLEVIKGTGTNRVDGSTSGR